MPVGYSIIRIGARLAINGIFIKSKKKYRSFPVAVRKGLFAFAI